MKAHASLVIATILAAGAFSQETAPSSALESGKALTFEMATSSRVFSYVVSTESSLHVFASSKDVDLKLRIEDPVAGKVLAEDDDSGGNTTPYSRFDVKPS